MLLGKPPEGTGPIDRFRIHGERCSGTAYLKALVEANLPGLGHDQPPGLDVYNFLAPAFTDDRQLALVVVRDAFDWMRALHNNPHRVGAWAKETDLAGFLRHRWATVLPPGPAPGATEPQPPREVMFDRHPATGAPIANVVALRNLKLQSQLKVRHLYRHWAILRYEDLIGAPEAVIATLAERFGLDRAASFVPVKAPPLPRRRGARSYAPEDPAFVIGGLNHAQERLVGFDYGAEAQASGTPARARREGSLILMVGQSNMVGNHAPVEDVPDRLRAPPDTRIWLRRPQEFAPLVAGGDYQRRGVGPEIGLADEWQMLRQGPLALVKSARDGASLLTQLNHDPPGGLFNRLVIDTQRAMGVLGLPPTALIWMQGEFEARTEAEAAVYPDRFRAMLGALRDRLGAPLPTIVCARVSGLAAKYPFNDRINGAFEGAADLGVRVFETGDLTRLDQVHYDTESVLEAGRRAARTLLAARATGG